MRHNYIRHNYIGQNYVGQLEVRWCMNGRMRGMLAAIRACRRMQGPQTAKIIKKQKTETTFWTDRALP